LCVEERVRISFLFVSKGDPRSCSISARLKSHRAYDHYKFKQIKNTLHAAITLNTSLSLLQKLKHTPSHALCTFIFRNDALCTCVHWSLHTLSPKICCSLSPKFSLFHVSLTESQHSIANLTESPLSPSLSQDACSTSSSLSMMDCYSTVATAEQALLNDGGCMVQVRGAMARSAKTCYDGTASS
jgi:hypothetical protein